MIDRQQQIVAQLRAARKYRGLCDETVTRIARWALGRHDSVRQATKAAKRKLHQVHAAYCRHVDVERLPQQVDALPEPTDGAAFRAACRGLLRQHASTAERMGAITTLYPALWRQIGKPGTLLDLACGYHPFALPFMDLDEATTYHACDIDQRLIGAANTFLARLGRPPAAQCKDLLVGMPKVSADVALLFKTLPCLEQQERGIGPELLRAIPARCVVVSFPLQSLAGRHKAMRAGYDRRMSRIVAELGVAAQRLEFGNELFYVLAAGNDCRPGGSGGQATSATRGPPTGARESADLTAPPTQSWLNALPLIGRNAASSASGRGC